MKIFWLLFLLGAFIPSAALAGPQRVGAYQYGDGAAAFSLRVDGRSGQLPRYRVQAGDIAVNVEQTLGAGGDVLYTDQNGRILVRLGPNGGATYYPDGHKNGLPVLRQTANALAAQDLSSLEDWDRAYRYKGGVDHNGKIEPSN